jgi:hypothetical protein
MKRNLIFSLLLCLSLAFVSCKEEAGPDLPKGVRWVVIQKKEDAGRYSYMLVKEKDKEYWIATQHLDSKKGDTIYFTTSYENKNFKSEGLKRTFKSLWFVEDATTQKPSDKINKENPHPQVATGKAEVNIPKAEGGVSVADIFKNPSNFKDKVVKIKGVVTKYNPNIMNRNWLHLQDGTSQNNNYDITITTNDAASLGDTVTVQGKVVLNKDFGAGYKYEIVVEEGKILEGATKRSDSAGGHTI